MFGRDAGGLRGKRSKDGPLGAAGRSGSGLSPTGSGLFGMPAPGKVNVFIDISCWNTMQIVFIE